MSSATVGLLLVTFNHQEFINQCLESIEREFSPALDLVIADAGSTDQTLSCEVLKLNRFPNSKVVALRESPTCRTVRVGLESLGNDYVCILSADDYLMPGYERWVTGALRNATQPVCLSPGLELHGETPSRHSEVTAKWTGYPWLDRLQSFLRNPGRGPGVVVPRILAVETLRGHDQCAIEDLILWYGLVGRVKMVRSRKPQVAYRVHPQGQSTLRSDQYMWSLGYCAGLNQARAQAWWERVLARWGGLRIRSTVEPNMLEMFESGYQVARRQ